MLNSIYFMAKADVGEDKLGIIELFFKDWVDTTCNNEVHYRVEQIPYLVDASIGFYFQDPPRYTSFRVDFERQEDALALRLRGVPSEFQDYLEIIE